jgi:hypothetical protein
MCEHTCARLTRDMLAAWFGGSPRWAAAAVECAQLIAGCVVENASWPGSSNRRLVDKGSTCAGRNWALESSMVLAATKFRESASRGQRPPAAAARREWSSPRRLPSGPNDDGRFEATQLEVGAGVGQLARSYYGLRVFYIFDIPRGLALC